MPMHPTTTNDDDLLEPLRPDVARSQAAFRKDLPRLLERRYRHWVAIRDGKLIKFARTRQKLERKLERQSIRPDEVIVRCIIPDVPADQVEHLF